MVAQITNSGHFAVSVRTHDAVFGFQIQVALPGFLQQPGRTGRPVLAWRDRVHHGGLNSALQHLTDPAHGGHGRVQAARPGSGRPLPRRDRWRAAFGDGVQSRAVRGRIELNRPPVGDLELAQFRIAPAAAAHAKVSFLLHRQFQRHEQQSPCAGHHQCGESINATHQHPGR